jgi:hypothetical protein
MKSLPVTECIFQTVLHPEMTINNAWNLTLFSAVYFDGNKKRTALERSSAIHACLLLVSE